MTSGRLSVWLSHANPIYRRGLIACLEAEAIALAREEVRLSRRVEPADADVLLFDASQGCLAEVLSMQRGSSVALVALARDEHDEAIVEAVGGGVAAVLLQDELQPDALIAALRTVATGNSAIPARLLSRILEQAGRGNRRHGGAVDQREICVLRELAAGADTQEIAQRLDYSDRMVKRIVHDLLVKLNCRNRAQAVALAVRQGMI